MSFVGGQAAKMICVTINRRLGKPVLPQVRRKKWQSFATQREERQLEFFLSAALI
jgi:hypothetical protein